MSTWYHCEYKYVVVQPIYRLTIHCTHIEVVSYTEPQYQCLTCIKLHNSENYLQNIVKNEPTVVCTVNIHASPWSTLHISLTNLSTCSSPTIIDRVGGAR